MGYTRPRVERFVSLVLARPRTVILCVAVVTALLGAELRHLRPQVDLDDLMPRGHPYRLIDDRLREEFGAGQTAMIAIGVREGDVFTPGHRCARIQRLTRGRRGAAGRACRRACSR